MHIKDVTEKHWRLIKKGCCRFRIHVDSIGDAIALADRLRIQGVCDLFRGQANAEWKVTSSYERLPLEQRPDVELQIGRFLRWAAGIDQLKDVASDQDAALAIAQHYGLKTTFIDFTTEPSIAAFFATELKNDPFPAQNAAIACLNSKEFSKFWEGPGSAYLGETCGKGRIPAIIRIDVKNLWRLQTQRGCFLWNPVFGIEEIFDFDRIIFPFTRIHSALPSRDHIYPKDQSSLEHLLTRFLMNERMREGAAVLETLQCAERFELTVDESAYEITSWYPQNIQETADWQEASKWTAIDDQHADHALYSPFITFQNSVSVKEFAVEVCTVLDEVIMSKMRSRVISFRWLEGSVTSSLVSRLSACIRRLWNGMRRLPFTESEIKLSLQLTIQLFLSAQRDPQSADVIDLVTGSLGDDCLYVEMSSNPSGAGDYSRGYVSSARLMRAHNPEFIRVATKHLGVKKLNSVDSLLSLARPWQRFSFTGLRDLMVTELIPSQIVLRGELEGEQALQRAIYFSPSEFKIFGLA